ncbi:hypothetical protein PRZ48_010565 [Zasmidium cellare]|uniref:Uncharacterized protein n=1 Tax=Zasmidium cellare TaxID=395010 RepID=A0ABR0E955_ZASCE|nr:hypothetical protein PRZ48_010565 [Zasmidium cellare]
MRTSHRRSSDLQQLQQQLQQIVTDLAQPRDLRMRHRKIPPKMPRGLCFYSRCKNAELEAFYKERTGVDVPKPKKRMTKKDLANELRKVDRRPWNYGRKSFRFQDLPPEMRNLVYRELLPVRSPDGVRESNEPRCQTAILRSCKQIHTEAQSILYGDHEGEVAIKSTHTIAWRGPEVLNRETGMFSRLYKIDSAGGPFSLARIRSDWPACLRKFERINVKVSMTLLNVPQVDDFTRTTYAGVNQELSGLVSFLSTSTALKAITITVAVHTNRPSEDDADLLRMLRPLTLLGPKVNVSIVDVPQAVKDQILREKEERTHTKHFFADFQETRASIQELEYFQSIVDSKNTLAGVNGQRNRMQGVFDGVRGFVDSDVEKKLKAATAEAKAFLASGVVDKLGRLARKKAKEIKQEAAKKVDELEAQRQKFIEMGKAAKDAAGTDKTAEDTSTNSMDDTPTDAADDASLTAVSGHTLMVIHP